MTRDSDISSVPQSVQAASSLLRRWGLGKFWTEFVLGILSCFPIGASLLTSGNKGGEVGGFWAVCGLVTLGISLFFSWRYLAFAKSLRLNEAGERPKRVDTQKIVKRGLLVNLAGMALCLLGTQAAVGSSLVKSFQQTGSNVAQGGCILNSADIFGIQANTAIFTVHFIGLSISLWLLNRLTK